MPEERLEAITMRLMKNTVSILLACCVLIAAMPVNALAVSTSDLSKRIIGVWGNDAAVSQDSMSSFANAYNTTFFNGWTGIPKRMEESGRWNLSHSQREHSCCYI